MTLQYILRSIKNWLFGKKEAEALPVTGVSGKGDATSQKDKDRLVANYSWRAKRCLVQMSLSDGPAEIEALRTTRETFLNEIEKLSK